MSINYGKDLIIKNVNPNAENIGDCVIRSFTSYFEDELTYEEIKNEILAISKSYGSTNPQAYQRPIYFENFAKDANMVKIYVDDKKEFSTGNRLIKFCKKNKINAIGISNTHAAYVDYKVGLIDTWDSRRKHINYILINKDDALFIGAKPEKNDRFAREIEIFEF